MQQYKIFIFFTWIFFINSTTIVAQSNNTVLYTLTEKNGLTDNVATCFFQDSRGIIWIGTYYGLNTYDG